MNSFSPKWTFFFCSLLNVLSIKKKTFSSNHHQDHYHDHFVCYVFVILFEWNWAATTINTTCSSSTNCLKNNNNIYTRQTFIFNFSFIHSFIYFMHKTITLILLHLRKKTKQISTCCSFDIDFMTQNSFFFIISNIKFIHLVFWFVMVMSLLVTTT